MAASSSGWTIQYTVHRAMADRRRYRNPKGHLLAVDAPQSLFCDTRRFLCPGVPAPKGEGGHTPTKPYVRELLRQRKRYPVLIAQWMSNPCPRTDAPGCSRASVPGRPSVKVSGIVQQYLPDHWFRDL